MRPFADGGFDTPSGKFEFYAERLIAHGLDPLPAFTPPHETLGDGPYPLNFLSRKHKDSINANYGHLPIMQRQKAVARTLEMHPTTPTPRASATAKRSASSTAAASSCSRCGSPPTSRPARSPPTGAIGTNSPTARAR